MLRQLRESSSKPPVAVKNHQEPNASFARVSFPISTINLVPWPPYTDVASPLPPFTLFYSALGEESDDDFIFSREPARRAGPTSSAVTGISAAARVQASRNGASIPSSSRTVFEPLPDAAGGETPIIRRNQAFRAGLEKHPRRPSGREAEQNRRSSLNLKGQRRVSSLRDGTAAYPHDDVPDHELFRHCSDQLPPVVRMKHLIGWILKRSLDIADGRAELPVRSRDAAKKSKGKAKESNELPVFSEDELKLIRSRRSELAAVLEQLLTDLNEGVFGISWMGRSEEVSSDS